ncbi:glycosyltransferase family 4 protein [Sneathiella limimaris]|uniref:glycosyltransferase family 4 protein n=1 Tax=Sneathiella limimaris TaxID=1964213 RepID=UPI00146EC3E5|nr:glycosyltransferase family 4 protein [Sneathiella limimaris]
MQQIENTAPVITVVLKGYPRLSETFIAQELRALEKLGHKLHLISLRFPTDKKTHPVHEEMEALVTYLPEYLHQEPVRVLKSWWSARKLPGYKKAFRTWIRDLFRDFSRNRVRRFGQAMVLAAEFPENSPMIYAHFLHTPASVARYAAFCLDLPWSCSAHAKDIYTSPNWEISEKLADVSWLVTCTAFNVDHLRQLAADPAKIELLYHGLDFDRFEVAAPEEHERSGESTENPVRILSVGRAVEKKGYDDVLAALSRLPKDLNWEFSHIGGGPLLEGLKGQAAISDYADRCHWLGPQSQAEVKEAMRSADIFVLASRIAGDGDRDGLPNVLMEAQSQKAAIVATSVSAIPELIVDNHTGLLVSQNSPEELALALESLIRNPALRTRLSDKGYEKLLSEFDASNWITQLSAKLPKGPV